MTVNSLTAANAYRNQLNMMDGISDAVTTSDDSTSFGDLLTNALKSASDTQYGAEKSQMQSLTGNVDLSDLVTAVSSAELSLNTVVAIRDKVINAYQDIIKMPI